MNVYQLVEKHEERRKFVYDDATGKPVVPGYTMVGHATVGVGRNLEAKGLSDDEIEDLLHSDVTECIADLSDLSDLLGEAFEEASEPRRAALIDMRFTLGGAGFRKFHQMINCVIAGQWLAAADAALDSAWARVEAPARARADARLLKVGAWDAGAA